MTDYCWKITVNLQIHLQGNVRSLLNGAESVSETYIRNIQPHLESHIRSQEGTIIHLSEGGDSCSFT